MPSTTTSSVTSAWSSWPIRGWTQTTKSAPVGHRYLRVSPSVRPMGSSGRYWSTCPPLRFVQGISKPGSAPRLMAEPAQPVRELVDGGDGTDAGLGGDIGIDGGTLQQLAVLGGERSGPALRHRQSPRCHHAGGGHRRARSAGMPSSGRCPAPGRSPPTRPDSCRRGAAGRRHRPEACSPSTWSTWPSSASSWTSTPTPAQRRQDARQCAELVVDVGGRFGPAGLRAGRPGPPLPVCE